MNAKKQLSYDYGTLDGVVTDRAASNITELWWNLEKQQLLDLWTVTEGKDRTSKSDYDKFRALCEMMPLLCGHPIKGRCERILQDCFDIADSIDLQNCDEIWRKTADALLLSPMNPMSLAGQIAIPDVQKICLAETLLATDAENLQAWQSDFDARIAQANAKGFDRILLHIQSGFVFAEPDPYHVGLALKQRKTVDGRNILAAQGVRMLAEACVKRGWSLQVELGARAEEAVELFSYVERTVGLPALVWSTPYEDTRDAMLSFGARRHTNPVLPLIRLADHPSNGELTRAIEAYAARVPLGLLCFACGNDARDNAAERERLFGILKNFERENLL